MPAHKMITKNICIVMMFILVWTPFVSAGVGIKWSQESLRVQEGEGGCLTYSVYNPWPGKHERTYVQITLSSQLKEVLEVQDIESVLIPEETGLDEAIPVEFCFEVPKKIYSKNCWMGDFFVCERECLEEQKLYD